jgi:hypothetical protein
MARVWRAVHFRPIVPIAGVQHEPVRDPEHVCRKTPQLFTGVAQPVSTVYQGGPRKLWEEIEAAYRWWEAEEGPGIHRFGLTVSQQGEQSWLDTPERPVAPPVARLLGPTF